MFAINPFIGKVVHGVTEYATPEELLEHLDYLEIDRSLVSSNDALHYSPYHCNRELLETIAPYRERLYPCFVITPADFYEQGNIEFYREQMRQGNRAFYLCPKEQNFQIRDIERVIAAIADLRPVFFLVSAFGTSPQMFIDVADIAQKYPQVTFVCTKQMWGKFPSTLDLMWRCRNVLLDISWLHMRDTMEMLAADFGAERLVFGIGGKAQYGAAIAALAHSRLTQEQKELVEHGNLERILGIAPLKKQLYKKTAILEEKPLWKCFRQGNSIKELVDFPIVDIHAHTGSFSGGWCIPESSLPLKQHFVSFMNFMDRHGVTRIIDASGRALHAEPVQGNAEAEKCGSQYPDRFSGWFCFNANYSESITEELLDGFFARGYFVGIKLLPSYQGIPVTDARYRVVYEYAAKHRLPVLSHTWGDRYDAPRLFRDIVAEFPEMRFIVGHSGGSDLKDRLDAEALVRDFPNVYLDSCAIFCGARPWQEAIKAFGNRRFLFGSDAGPHNEAYELGNLLSLPIPDKEILPILGQNWRRIQSERI